MVLVLLFKLDFFLINQHNLVWISANMAEIFPVPLFSQLTKWSKHVRYNTTYKPLAVSFQCMTKSTTIKKKKKKKKNIEDYKGQTIKENSLQTLGFKEYHGVEYLSFYIHWAWFGKSSNPDFQKGRDKRSSKRSQFFLATRLRKWCPNNKTCCQYSKTTAYEWLPFW